MTLTLDIRHYIIYLYNFIEAIKAEEKLFNAASLCSSLEDFKEIGENLKYTDCEKKFCWLVSKIYRLCDDDLESLASFLYSAIFGKNEYCFFNSISYFRQCRQVEAEWQEQQKEAEA